MDSINSILHSEFFIATGYLERLIFALTEMSEFHYTPTGRDLFKSTLDQYNFFFSHELKFDFNQSSESKFQVGTFRKNIKAYHQYVEKYLALPFSSSNKWKFTVDFINLTYKISHEIHNYTLKYTQFDVQYPRLALVREKNIANEIEDLTISKEFYIDLNEVIELNNELNLNSKVDFLELKRNEKYDHFIQKGHFNISEKNYEKAQENFYKAKNYQETAEVFTLLAWSYSFLNNYEKAKNYCLKAIAIDPQYGPAYNDFGNYLLTEGNVKESFKWFELAKRALNYQNREYPYINAGRAYMLQQNFTAAIREFSTALILAPYHEELHDTVKKLKLNLERNNYKIPNSVSNQEMFNET